MNDRELAGTLEFLRAAEKLKTVHRSAYTSDGAQESTAEHTWRLCLMALVLRGEFPGIDFERLLRILVVHDLGEAISGDVPAPQQNAAAPKSERERQDLLRLVRPLPAAARDDILALWDEYEAAATPEAKLAKALDKLETILQHNQGLNPPSFDYGFNLDYGKRFTTAPEIVARIRAILDKDTEANASR